MKTYMGIDPGKTGGFAIVDEDGHANTQIWDDETFVSFAKEHADKITKCCVEHVWALPGQSISAMFNFGKSAGFIEGVLNTLNIPYELVSPAKWKKEFGLSSDKQQSIDTCKQLFPSVNLLPTARCKKPSDGMAEALLMAEYARRKL